MLVTNLLLFALLVVGGLLLFAQMQTGSFVVQALPELRKLTEHFAQLTDDADDADIADEADIALRRIEHDLPLGMHRNDEEPADCNYLRGSNRDRLEESLDASVERVFGAGPVITPMPRVSDGNDNTFRPSPTPRRVRKVVTTDPNPTRLHNLATINDPNNPGHGAE